VLRRGERGLPGATRGNSRNVVAQVGMSRLRVFFVCFLFFFCFCFFSRTATTESGGGET
jgi:hypothetical protein